MLEGRGTLSDRQFDILVIGAGIFGACVAWSAALRGYAVALIDQGDFGAATSSNHYKFIHGGIRYLQHLDLARLRESSREKSALIRIAPHLAYPMPIVLPTYGHGKRSKTILRAAMAAYDCLTLDRNRGIADPLRRTPNGSTLTREEVLSLFPGVLERGLTGAAVFYDGQMYNPPRLVLAFVRSAIEKGAIAANYVRATGFLRDGSRVIGCRAYDMSADDEIEIRSRIVVNAAGPWAHYLLRGDPQLALRNEPSFSRDLAFVVNRQVCATHALGCQAESRDTDALLDRGGRHLFLVPWRGRTLIGVWHKHTRSHPEQITVAENELLGFIHEINAAYPPLALQPQDVEIVNTGLILFGSETAQRSSTTHSFAKRSMLIDHGSSGHEGLITLVGARATVARGMAEKTLQMIDKKWKVRHRAADSETTPIFGGDFPSFRELVTEIQDCLPRGDRATAEAIANNYGTRYPDVLACASSPDDLERLGESHVIRAELRHAVRREMARTLEDVVMRRTELGSAGHPGDNVLLDAAGIVASELSWSSEQRSAQIQAVSNLLDNRGPWKFSDIDA